MKTSKHEHSYYYNYKVCVSCVQDPKLLSVQVFAHNELCVTLVGWWLFLLECLHALQTFVIFGTIYQMALCIVLEDLVLG